MKCSTPSLHRRNNSHAEAQRRSVTEGIAGPIFPLCASAPLREIHVLSQPRSYLLSVLLGFLFCASGAAQDGDATIRACPKCGWKPPVTKWGVRVSTIAELEQAAATVPASTTILVQDGTY